MKMRNGVAGVCLCLLSLSAHTESTLTTQQSIRQLDHKIHSLEQHLAQTQDTQQLLHQNLAKIAQLIAHNAATLAKLHSKISVKKIAIAEITQEIADLRPQVIALQNQLGQALKARYKHPLPPPLKSLLLAEARRDRILQYYAYLIHANQQSVSTLKEMQVRLKSQQEALQTELLALAKLESQLDAEQQKQVSYHHQHQSLLQKLNQDIASETQILDKYAVNRRNLSRILHGLTQQSVIQTRRPMTRMKKQLPEPVSTTQRERHDQGVLFYAKVGMPVVAVYPGKVVFADWLNGYGLLLILDHGWGLMTLYANNQAFTKRSGDIVSQGEQIATVGHSGTVREAALYFEVRRHGKAVPPLEWLVR